MDQHSDFDSLIAQGLAASEEGRAEAALAHFARAAELAPASGVPPFLIGSEHAAAGQHEAAEAAFASAVLLAPEFTLARYQLGLLQFSSGRTAMALLTWVPLLEAPAGDALGHYVRGFAALAKDELAAARGQFRAGLACPDGSPAVAADIRRVLDAVEALCAGTDVPSEGAADNASHVLLAAYSRGLH